MIKELILKNEQTNEYFTNDYNGYWSRNVEDAYKYDATQDMESILNSLVSNNYAPPLEGVRYLELVTIFQIINSK